ncbi:helix-turn-helix domain-containing protein [Streptomyces bobili]|uniref:AraC-like ligand-binding domain-containing protein n=1 Tax=Streptomyces bobili TaxID=67280 RepID=UPI003433AA21
MIEKVFRTTDVPTSDRFDFWRELISRTHAPVELASVHRHDFRAQQRLLDLGDALIWPTTFHPVRFIRTPKLIRQSDPEGIHVSLPLHGTLGASQNNQEIAAGPFALCVIDTSRPFTVTAGEDGRTHTGIGLEIPKALLPLTSNRVDLLFPSRIPAQQGIAALFAQFLRQLSSDTTSYTPADGPRIATVVVDLLSSLFAHIADDDRSLTPESRRRTLTLRIRAFIRQHLHDPLLTPPVIAAAHHISVSYLHRLFQDEEDTVAAFVRRQRLERARHDLSDPAQRTIPVHEVAARWGFTHQAAFSRTFRSVYGVSPRGYRQAALADASGPALQ